jgi:hypothetical protein
MEPQNSLPCSQDPATGTYEPDETGPHGHILLLKNSFQKNRFPSGSPTKLAYLFSISLIFTNRRDKPSSFGPYDTVNNTGKKYEKWDAY